MPGWACGREGGVQVTVPRELPALGGYVRRGTVHGDGDEISLHLPHDFPDGGVLRLRGQGEELADGRPGDLLLTIRFDPPPGPRPLTIPDRILHGQALATTGASPMTIAILVTVAAVWAAIFLL